MTARGVSAACDGFRFVRNTAATFDVFYWLQITNFDAFLFNPAPSGLDYNDVWPLCVHAQNGLRPLPKRLKRNVDNGTRCSVHFIFELADWCHLTE